MSSFPNLRTVAKLGFCNHVFLLLMLIVTFPVVNFVAGADSDVPEVYGTGAQMSHHVINNLQSLKRSQDELFKKIDRLSKAVEEKDHEDYQFRLKFSRKVHTLESKVLYMEHTFTQKLEQVVQKKVADAMALADNRLRYPNSESTSGPFSPSRSHGSRGAGAMHDDDDDDNDTVGLLNNIQAHQPSSAYNVHPSYQRSYQPFHQHRQSPAFNNYPQNINMNNNNNQHWGFYEHPITQKRVRESQPHLFGYEPPTRDLPLISLVANTAVAPQPQYQTSSIVEENPTPTDRMASKLVAEREDQTEKGERNGTIPKFLEDAQKRFESFDTTLQALQENVKNLEKEVTRSLRYSDYSEVHTQLVETRKDVSGLHQMHQDMVRRLEHFIVEIEKRAAKREYSVNESLVEMDSELRKQIAAVKAFTKKQIQNMTTNGSVATLGSSQTPDKLRCAQTLLDEMLAQIGNNNKPSSGRHLPLLQYETIADQAGSQEQKGMDRNSLYMSRRSAEKPTAENLLKELATQRKEIMELKAEIGKLNISQVLLMRTVDEETLKRSVRPRDCTEIRLLRNASDGIYSIFPRMNDVATQVYCDMSSDGGGWTVIQRRGVPMPVLLENFETGRESFARSWKEYEKGFGSLHGDFWLGLSNIELLCQLGVQELRVELTNWAGETRFANYQYFKIANSSQLYRIYTKAYSGNAGDSLSRHNGMAFSTPDKDHDADPRRHCAKTYSAGWWYYACFESNLNGLYIGDGNTNHTHYAFGTGIIWQHWMDNNYSLKRAEMKIRNRFI